MGHTVRPTGWLNRNAESVAHRFDNAFFIGAREQIEIGADIRQVIERLDHDSGAADFLQGLTNLIEPVRCGSYPLMLRRYQGAKAICDRWGRLALQSANHHMVR